MASLPDCKIRLFDVNENLRQQINSLRTEVSCRIEHGAESGGHLEYVLAEIDSLLCDHCEEKKAVSGGLCYQCEELQAEGRSEL